MLLSKGTPAKPEHSRHSSGRPCSSSLSLCLKPLDYIPRASHQGPFSYLATSSFLRLITKEPKYQGPVIKIYCLATQLTCPVRIFQFILAQTMLFLLKNDTLLEKPKNKKQKNKNTLVEPFTFLPNPVAASHPIFPFQINKTFFCTENSTSSYVLYQL